MIERLSFTPDTPYDAMETAIHLNRYAMAQPFCKGSMVLDAACGEGYGSYLMKRWGAVHVEGVDISDEAIESAKKNFITDGLHYLQHDISQLPYDNESFDLVVSFETIEHLDEAACFLKEIRRVLKPNGVVLISCPNDNYYYEKDGLKNPFHKRTFTFFEFKELSESFLGNNVSYYLSFAVDGFINLPINQSTYPDNTTEQTNLGVLHYDECMCVKRLPQERALNHWNCNYYLGVWNASGKTGQGSAAICPRETFIDHKDKDYDLLYHFDDIRNKNLEYQRKIEDVSIECDRLKALLHLVEKEKRLQEVTLANVQKELAQYRRSMAEIESSNGMKLLRIYSRFRSRISRFLQRVHK